MTTQPINYFTRKPYTGINAHLPAGQYATFLQWKGHGFQVEKGSKGYKVVKVIDIEKRDKATQKVTEGTAVKYYTVFELAQVKTLDGNALGHFLTTSLNQVAN